MSEKTINSTIQYNKAKPWEVILFASKDVVPNVFLFLMTFVSYLATGSYGILVSVAGVIVTASRIFDGITDPIAGFIIDKTNTKFGRFRPMMVLGYVICTISLLLMYFVGIGSGVVVFTLIYVLYIIGYTFFTTASNAARSVLTNEPKQRASNGRWTGIFVLCLSTAFSSVYVSWLPRRFGGFTLPALQEMCITAIIIAGIFTILACIAISSKDKPEFYGAAASNQIKFGDVFKTLKGNRPLQLMIVAATSDKLALQAASNSSIGIMVFGIIVGNYAFRGNLALWSFIPTILMIFFGMTVAAKFGFKKATILSSWGGILFSIILFLVFLISPTQIGTGFFATAIFLIAYILRSGFTQVATSCIPPMIADIADYETARSGKFMAGTVNAVYTFVDKLITSLNTTIVALMLSSIGFVDTLPQPTDLVTTPIFIVAMVVFLGFPVIGWICNIIVMKFYHLSPEKMKEVHMQIAQQKATVK